MATISVEVIAPVIPAIESCRHCRDFFRDAGIAERVNRDLLSSYPEEVRRAYARLCQMMHNLSVRHGPGLKFTLIDPQTPMGLWKTLRHRVRAYPTFIVDGHATYAGWNEEAISDLLRQGVAGTSAESRTP